MDDHYYIGSYVKIDSPVETVFNRFDDALKLCCKLFKDKNGIYAIIRDDNVICYIQFDGKGIIPCFYKFVRICANWRKSAKFERW